MLVNFTLKSRNAKTGPIPVSTSSSDTCPQACPLKGAGCYAGGGPLGILWRKVSAGTVGMSWQAFCEAIAALPACQLWRHNQAGDLPGIGNDIDETAILRLIEANKGKRGFTYTHKPVDASHANNAMLVAHANSEGFTVNLSANNLSEADELAALGIAPVVSVLPKEQTSNTTTPAGRKVVVCPATQREGVSCATCQLCQRADRKVIVGFPAHGMRATKASEIACN